MPPAADSLPYLTAHFPGIGGRLKVEPEDFVVDEIPSYEPSGTGEHLFLWIEKRDLPHDLLLQFLSKELGIPAQDIGVAGIKDRRAVTRQYVSVPTRLAGQIEQLASEQLRVLRAAPHGNKLRTGHLRGNRFRILVRDVTEDAEVRANEILNVLRESGFPNYYGDQRFGHEGQTLALGLDLLNGRKSPREIPYHKRKFLLRFALSSVQSDLFNKSLVLRMQDRLLSTVLEGDVLEVNESGGKFIVEDVARESSRLDAGEVSVTGPMFGVKMLTPLAVAAERETKLLGESGLTLDDFGKYAQLLSGARRAYLSRVPDLSCRRVSGGMQFDFTLPSGVYATTLLREFMKTADQDQVTVVQDRTDVRT